MRLLRWKLGGQMKRIKTVAWVVGIATLVVLAGGQAAVIAVRMSRPPAETFGLGPRESRTAMYRAMLLTDEPLRKRALQTIYVVITDRDGHPVDGATIAIDGGMPQHGHGLPTAPRVSEALGGGTYQIDGVRFNMGGWWEFRLHIATPAGSDTITFNLSL